MRAEQTEEGEQLTEDSVLAPHRSRGRASIGNVKKCLPFRKSHANIPESHNYSCGKHLLDARYLPRLQSILLT